MQLRNLWSIKKFIDSDTLAMLTPCTRLHLATLTFVTSKLDYGNALLCGIPKNHNVEATVRTKLCSQVDQSLVLEQDLEIIF